MKIVIEGITKDGKKFRPSDWAERICGSLSSYRNHRFYYSRELRPSHKNGNKCVVMDLHLKESHPELYKQIIDFVKSNHLKMYHEGNHEKN
jgi:hypothetical protein